VQYRGLEGGPPYCLGLGVVLSAPDDAVISARYGFEIQAVRNYGFAIVRETVALCIGAVANASGSTDAGMDFASSVGALVPAIQANALVLPLSGRCPIQFPCLVFYPGLRVYAH